MTSADTQSAPAQAQGGGVPPAGPQEHLIPKSRFDEVLETNRQQAAQIAELAGLIQRLSPQNQPQNSNALPPDLNPEELGLEPHQFKAMMRIADHLSDAKVKAVAPQIRQQLGIVMNTAEEAAFVAREGADAGKYVDKIRAYRESHYRSTGMPMDIATAYKLIRYDEITSKGRSASPAPAPQAQPNPATVAPAAAQAAAAPAAQAQGFPTGDLTRGAPGAAAAAAGATPGFGSQELDEKGLEDLEAQLDRQLASQGMRI